MLQLIIVVEIVRNSIIIHLNTNVNMILYFQMLEKMKLLIKQMLIKVWVCLHQIKN